MNRYKAFKFRIYPNKKQRELIEETFGCVRFIYNSMLAERKEVYNKLKNSQNNELLYSYKYKTEKDYKLKYDWLDKVDSIALQQARIDLLSAYSNFFKSFSGKRKGKFNFPKFHKKGYRESYRSVAIGNNIRVDFDSRQIKIPKVGWVKYRDDRIFDNSLIKQITLSKSKTGKYFISILTKVEIDNIRKIPYSSKLIITGFDMSLSKFFVDSNGNSPEYKKQFKDKLKRLAYLQKTS